MIFTNTGENVIKADINHDKTRKFIYSWLDVRPQISTLDLGCGRDDDLEEISQLVDGESVLYGIDMSEDSIEEAKKKESDAGLRFLKGDEPGETNKASDNCQQ